MEVAIVAVDQILITLHEAEAVGNTKITPVDSEACTQVLACVIILRKYLNIRVDILLLRIIVGNMEGRKLNLVSIRRLAGFIHQDTIFKRNRFVFHLATCKHERLALIEHRQIVKDILPVHIGLNHRNADVGITGCGFRCSNLVRKVCTLVLQICDTSIQNVDLPCQDIVLFLLSCYLTGISFFLATILILFCIRLIVELLIVCTVILKCFQLLIQTI